MRHRAPTALSRLLAGARSRRGAAAGAAVLVGTAGAYAAVGGWGSGAGDPVLADAPNDVRAGTSYPGDAALPSQTAPRSTPPSRGAARSRPARPVSEDAPQSHSPVGPAATAPAPSRPGGGPSTSRQPAAQRTPTASPPGSARPTEPGSASPSPSAPSPSPSAQTTEAPSQATAAPDTTAVTQVATGRTWTVALVSDGALTSFECSLDGAAFTACGPVATFTDLRNGRHTLTARAVDAAGGVDPSPAVVATNVTGALL